MTNRVLLVGLSLSVAGGVALAAWTRRGGGAEPPSPARPAARSSADPAAARVDLGDEPVLPDDELPTEEARASAERPEWIDSQLDDDLRVIVERMNWCGTGTVGTFAGDTPVPPVTVDDGQIRVRVTNDLAWNALLAGLPRTPLADDRLGLMGTFLLERATSAPRADLAALARDLASIESDPGLVRRLNRAADALVAPADDAWKAYLEPTPPPPPPSTARPSGR